MVVQVSIKPQRGTGAMMSVRLGYWYGSGQFRLRIACVEIYQAVISGCKTAWTFVTG